MEIFAIGGIIWLLLAIAIFILLRFFWLWYWKIDKVVESLVSIKELLVMIKEEIMDVNNKLNKENK